MTIPYGIAETIGLRSHMEDAHSVWQDERLGIVSAEVYDGHVGSLAASLAAEMLTPYFLNAMKRESEKTGEKGFAPEVLRDAYLATDRYIIDRQTESGAAVATLYLHGGRFLAANVGDVRVVIGEGTGAISLTVDHKPDLPGERARIEAQGGRVITFDVPRVQGLLAMSRSLGDAPLKPFVTAEPRIAEGLLGRRNDIAIVACDGIWDVLTSEEAVAIARAARAPEDAAKQLQTQALERGSTDNITVIVLDLRQHTLTCERDRLYVSRVLDRA
ncbi:MAG: PP2C family protein-serine/threonine phosphatase [Syntrophorhabdales bacterium]|jgi:protein phosphatase 1L